MDVELVLGPRVPQGLQELLIEAYQGRSIHDAFQVMDSLACERDCQVWVVQARSSGQRAVLKSYQRSILDAQRKLQVELEIELHRRLSAASPHVVQFWGALDDATHTHILMEHCAGGDLRAAVSGGAFCGEARLREGLVRPLLHVLSALAARGVVHRDIKPENIFVADGAVRLGDFGLALPVGAAECITPRRRASSSSDDSASDGRAGGAADRAGGAADRAGGAADRAGGGCDSGASASGSACGSGSAALGLGGKGRSASFASLAALDVGAPQEHAAGTAAYTAPEVLMAALTQSSVAEVTQPKNDVFALGLVALECLTRAHPFVGASGDASSGSIVCMALSGGPVPLPAPAPPRGGAAGPGGADDDAEGPSEACVDWLRRALEKDPARRPTAEELLAHEWLACCGGDCGGGGGGGGRVAASEPVRTAKAPPEQQPRGRAAKSDWAWPPCGGGGSGGGAGACEGGLLSNDSALMRRATTLRACAWEPAHAAAAHGAGLGHGYAHHGHAAAAAAPGERWGPHSAAACWED